MITNADHDSQPPATGDTDGSLFRPDESVRHGMLHTCNPIPSDAIVLNQ